MRKIWLTSDLHFCHDREFIWGPRGFNSVWEMNETIVKNWNSVVEIDDDVYVLGDLMLNNNDGGLRFIKQLKGRIHVVLGNHDTVIREGLYKECYNIVEVKEAIRFNYNGYHFFLTHYPCLTGNLEKESLKKCTCNFFGHTHSKDKFYEDRPYMYNIALDAHNCTPVLINDAIADMNEKARECLDML